MQDLKERKCAPILALVDVPFLAGDIYAITYVILPPPPRLLLLLFIFIAIASLAKKENQYELGAMEILFC